MAAAIVAACAGPGEIVLEDAHVLTSFLLRFAFRLTQRSSVKAVALGSRRQGAGYGPKQGNDASWKGDFAGDRTADAGFDRGERVSGPVLNTAFAGNQDAVVEQPMARRGARATRQRALDVRASQPGRAAPATAWSTRSARSGPPPRPWCSPSG